MVYSKLIYANGKDHYEIAQDVIKEESTGSSNQSIMMYASNAAPITAELAAVVKVIPASSVMFKDILSVILTFNTLHAVNIVDNLPDDLVVVIPECDRYLKFVAVELVQSVLNQLVYMGVRLVFISDTNPDSDSVVNMLSFEDVTQM